MDVRSSFAYRPRNVAGKIQNGITVFDTVTNAPQTITALENMNAIDLGNNSDNYVQAAISTVDVNGTPGTDFIFMFPGSTESWSFNGRFITAVSVVAVDEPTATLQTAATESAPGAGDGLVLAATATPGKVDVNLIET